jgi:hypothetical protein
MPGASPRSRRVSVLNANWTPDPHGADGRFELQLITDDGKRVSTPASACAVSAIVALARADTVLAWDPEHETLIVADVVGEMPWTRGGDQDPVS